MLDATNVDAISTRIASLIMLDTFVPLQPSDVNKNDIKLKRLKLANVYDVVEVFEKFFEIVSYNPYPAMIPICCCQNVVFGNIIYCQ